jgi:hypothetical protein
MQHSTTPLHKYSGYSNAESDLGLVPAEELARKIKNKTLQLSYVGYWLVHVRIRQGKPREQFLS